MKCIHTQKNKNKNQDHPLSIRTYLSMNDALSKVFSSIHAVHQGIFLGLIDSKKLKTLTEGQYSRWHYKQTTYNLSGLFNWEESVISDYFKDCKSILLGASGGGRETFALSRMGFNVTAFECNPSLVKSSRKLFKLQNIDAAVVQATPDHVPEEIGTFDGLIMGWGGYMHIESASNRIAFLKQMKTHLKKNGPFLVSFVAFPEESKKNYELIYNVAKTVRRLSGNKSKVEFGDNLYETTFSHYFNEFQIVEESKAAGFTVELYDGENGYAVLK